MEDEKALTEIRKIAYRLWVEDGRPDGEDRRHWDRAKEIWAFRTHNHVLEESGGSDAGTAKKPRSASKAA